VQTKVLAGQTSRHAGVFSKLPRLLQTPVMRSWGDQSGLRHHGADRSGRCGGGMGGTGEAASDQHASSQLAKHTTERPS
jgi:hypothetical protein